MKVTVGKYERKDIELLTNVHRASFIDYINTQIGKGYTREFFGWFLQYQNSITLKAEADGVICGYVIGAEIGYNSQLNAALKSISIKGLLTHPNVIFHKNFLFILKARLNAIFTNKKNAEVSLEGRGMSLVGIGVEPNYSGKGIGGSLIKEFENRAVQMNFDYLRLSVYKDNLRAKTLYENQGWESKQEDGQIVYYFKTLRINPN